VTNTVSTLSGYFKEVYADKVEDLVPQGSHIYNATPFVPREKQNGNSYHQPVVLTHEHGFTYAAASAGAFAINAAVAATHKDATVVGTQLLLETRIDYETAARGSGSPKAFGAVTQHIVQNMMNSFYKRLEIQYLYGGSNPRWSGVFRFGSQTDDSGTTQTYNVYAETWAPCIMAGLEGCKLDIYDDDGTNGAPSTKLNTTAAVVVQSVDFANKRVTVTGVEAELDTLVSAPATACYAFFEGAFGAEMVGLSTIAANTGTLFGIAGGTYSMWTGSEVSAGSTNLTFSKVIKAYDEPAGKGLDGDATLYVPQRAWSNMMTDQAALRRYGAQRDIRQGARGLVFEGQTGQIRIQPHGMIKQGMAVGIPDGSCKRLGATDITFRVPGMEEEQFLYQLPSNAGYGIRAYANQAIFTPQINGCVLIDDIVNS